MTNASIEVAKYHEKSDVDSSKRAQHHTLGTKPNQAASGDHGHDSIVEARDNNDDNTAQTNSVTYVALTSGAPNNSNCSNTIEAPASGKLLLLFSCKMHSATAGAYIITAPELRVGSAAGAVLAAAVDTNSIQHKIPVANSELTLSRAVLITGLPNTGLIWFVLMHRTTAAAVGSFRHRNIIAQPVW